MEMGERLNGHLPPRKVGRRTAPRPAGRPKPRRRVTADRVLYLSATAGPWALAVLLLAVSLPHLASGFESITRCGPVAGWLLAVAIDCSQVVAKLGLTMTRRYEVGRAARSTAAGIVAGTTVMSISLNVLAFLGGATGIHGVLLAWAAGVMLPLLVLALSYLGSAFALAKPKAGAIRGK